MSTPKIENNLGKKERKLVAEVRALKSRLAGFERNEPDRKGVTHALQENEASFCTLFNNMAQGAFYQMPDGHIRKANQAMLDIFGLTLDQLQGRTSMPPAWRVVHEDGSEFPGETHPSWLALKTGKEIRDVTAGIFNPKKKDYVWVSINAIPEFRAGEDKPYQVFVTVHDITERKHAEETLRKSDERIRNSLDKLIEGCQAGSAGIDWATETTSYTVHRLWFQTHQTPLWQFSGKTYSACQPVKSHLFHCKVWPMSGGQWECDSLQKSYPPRLSS